MEKTTTELTIEFIKEHPDIRSCLKKGLLNYSSLARFISKELSIEKKTSKEAILIAAIRFHEKLKQEMHNEKKVKSLFANSEIDIKNKIGVIILEKDSNIEELYEIQKKARKESGKIYILEGSNNYTVITSEKYYGVIVDKFKIKILKKIDGLTLITFRTSKEIEDIVGAISYITSLFAENGVNILEILSCWTETLFVIESKDVKKAMEFLRF